MSGHSKWSTIKRQKGVADNKRGQLFTKLGRELTVAARQGGGEPESNARLRLAIDRARDANMPKDTMERAVKRGSGADADAAALEEIVYEGYGPGGVAVLVHALTDNRNRTASDVRNVFSKAGGNLGESGSVAWQFETQGVIALATGDGEAEELALLAMDSAADAIEDVSVDNGSVEVSTRPAQLEAARRALTDAGITVASAEIANVPKNTIALEARQAEQTLRLLDKLDELDDVQRVSSNADFPEEVLAAYA